MGQLKLTNYGSATFTGTATQKLAVTATGEVIEIPIGAGPVDGSGTPNYVTKWIDADTLGDSVMYDDGTYIGIGTATPAVHLDVVGSIEATGYIQSDTRFQVGTQRVLDGSIYNYGSGTDIDIYTRSSGGTYNNGQLYLQADGKIGIGTITPSHSLDLVGDLGLEYTTTSTTGVIYKGGDRFLHDFKHPTGGGAIPNGFNVFLGTNSGNFTVGSTATATWHSSNNVGIGHNTLTQAALAYKNVAIGYRALYSLTDGGNNTGIGNDTLLYLTTGTYNTVVGGEAAGRIAAGTKNVIMGSYAGHGVLGASDYHGNVLLGYWAGNDLLTAGSYNILLGYQAGKSLTTGADNILIGRDIDASSITAVSELNIGNLIFATALGNGVTLSTGKVGIGTRTPARKLSIYEDTATNVYLQLANVTSGGGSSQGFEIVYGGLNASFINRTAGFIDFETNNVSRMRILSDGQIKAGNYGSGTFTGTATYKLSVDSSGNVIETPIGAGAVDGTGTTNYVAKWLDPDTLGDSQIFDNGTNVGIGTSSPSAKLEVVGAGKFTVGTTVVDIADNASFPIKITNSTAYALAQINGFQFGGYSSAGDEGFIKTSDNSRQLLLDPDGWKFKGASELVRITPTGDVGIGIAAPNEALDVVGNLEISGDYKIGSEVVAHYDGSNYFFGPAPITLGENAPTAINNLIIGESLTGSQYGQNSVIATSYNSIIGKSAGYRAGQGANYASYQTFIGMDAGYEMASVTTGDFRFNLGIGYQSLYKVGSIGVANVVEGNTGVGTFAGAQLGQSASSTISSNTLIGYGAGYRLAGNVATQVIGNVAIGYQTAWEFGYNTAVATDNYNTIIGYRAGFQWGSASSGGNLYNVLIGANAGKLWGDNASNQLIISSGSTGTTTPLIHGDFSLQTLAINGELKLPFYGVGTYTGTATQKLGVDASGNVIELPIGAGPVDGSGTTNYVTKWIDADTIGDSQIYDNGSFIGIDTTSAYAKFMIAINEANTTTVDYLQFQNKAGGYVDWSISKTGANNLSIINQGTGILNKPVMTFEYTATGGNVGIGLLDPTVPLEVNTGVATFKFSDYSMEYGSSLSIKTLANGYLWLRPNGAGNLSLDAGPTGVININKSSYATDVSINYDTGTSLFSDGTTGNIGIGDVLVPAAALDVGGGIKMADDATAASATNVGTQRYREDANNSYVDMCMRTGAATYAWINITQNNW